MHLRIQDVTVVKYDYNEKGLYIEYHLTGDPREYHYLVTPENIKELFYEVGMDPEEHLCQYDAILLVWRHINEKLGKKIGEYSGVDLIAKVAEIVAEHEKHEQRKVDRHLNIHRSI